LQAGNAEPFWYYVIQPKGSSEIIDLVKFSTYKEAVEAATQVLAKMNQAASSEVKRGASVRERLT